MFLTNIYYNFDMSYNYAIINLINAIINLINAT